MPPSAKKVDTPADTPQKKVDPSTPKKQVVFSRRGHHYVMSEEKSEVAREDEVDDKEEEEEDPQKDRILLWNWMMPSETVRQVDLRMAKQTFLRNNKRIQIRMCIRMALRFVLRNQVVYMV